jgi:hypothetical protein
MFWSLSSDFKSRLGLCLCLSLLKAGILGCVTVDVVLRVFVLRISLVDGPTHAGRFSKVVSKGADISAVTSCYCPQGKTRH